jgi:hypothetical protein
MSENHTARRVIVARLGNRIWVRMGIRFQSTGGGHSRRGTRGPRAGDTDSAARSQRPQGTGIPGHRGQARLAVPLQVSMAALRAEARDHAAT